MSLPPAVRANRHAKTPYTSIANYGRLPAGITTDGTLEVIAPVDYVSWTEEIAGFARRKVPGSRGHRLVIGAELSPAAKQGMQAAGWQIAPFS